MFVFNFSFFFTFFFLNILFSFLLDVADDSLQSIPPYINVPDSHFKGSTKEMRESEKSKLIQLALNESVDKQIKDQVCEYCNRTFSNFTFECHDCSERYEACIVSGKLIKDKSQRIECVSCRMPAIREEWNRWIKQFKTCPFCGVQGSLVR